MQIANGHLNATLASTVQQTKEVARMEHARCWLTKENTAQSPTLALPGACVTTKTPFLDVYLGFLLGQRT